MQSTCSIIDRHYDLPMILLICCWWMRDTGNGVHWCGQLWYCAIVAGDKWTRRPNRDQQQLRIACCTIWISIYICVYALAIYVCSILAMWWWLPPLQQLAKQINLMDNSDSILSSGFHSSSHHHHLSNNNHQQHLAGHPVASMHNQLIGLGGAHHLQGAGQNQQHQNSRSNSSNNHFDNLLNHHLNRLHNGPQSASSVSTSSSLDAEDHSFQAMLTDNLNASSTCGSLPPFCTL